MDRGQLHLETLKSELESTSAFVRVAIEEHDSWWLRYLDLVVDADKGTWGPDVWEYEGMAFVAERIAGSTVADALVDEGEGLLKLGQVDIVTPALQQQAMFRHEPSLTRHDPAPLPWPVHEFTIHRQNELPTSQQPGLLVGTRSPSFPSYETAFRAFFYGEFSPVGAGPLPSEVGRLRIANTDAWLKRIRVAPTHIDVWVAGEAVEGARLELNGSEFQVDKRVGKTGKVRLRLPSGLPDDAWLYLSRDGKWLDHRALGYRLHGVIDPRTLGIETDLSGDARTEIETIRSLGEGPQLEYKSALPDNTRDSKRKTLKTVAAFASGAGGSILFGINPDEMTLEGVVGTPQSIRDRLGDLIRGNLEPPDPTFDVRSAEIDGKLIVVLDVGRSPEPPYGLRFGDKPVEFYVRRGASTYPATQRELRDIAISSTSPSSPYV